MTSTASGQRYWLLDHFGGMLDHDVLHDRMTTRPVTGQTYPGLFFYAEDVTAPPFDVDLRKIVSLPMPLPALRAVPTDYTGLIALALRETRPVTYLTSTLFDHLHDDATEVREWERFLPVSEALLHALVIASDTGLSTLSTGEDATPGPLVIEHGHHARIGDLAFPLGENAERLEQIATLPPGTSHTVTLMTRNGPRDTLVRRV